MMRILFLDIDGVLITGQFVQLQQSAPGMSPPNGYALDPLAVSQVKQLVELTNAYLVITSSWRLNREQSLLWRRFMETMEQAGLQDRIIGVTPDLSGEGSHRFHEIKRWLEENKRLRIKGIAIVDDMTEMGPFTAKSLVVCDPYTGFTPDCMKLAVRMMLAGNRDWE